MKLLYRWAFALVKLRWKLTRPISVGVRLLLVQDREVLLVRHTYQPGWFLPGGGVKYGEALDQCARREAFEEGGVHIGELRLHGVYHLFWHGKSDHVAVFASENFTRQELKDWEIAEARFFPLDALPADIADGNQRRVEEYLQGGGPFYGKW